MNESRLIGLKALIAAAKPGECPFCGEPAKVRSMSPQAQWLRRKHGVGEYQLTCGEPECAVVAYTRYWKRDANAQKHAKNQAMSVAQGRRSA